MFVLLKLALVLFRPLIWATVLLLMAWVTRNPIRKRRLFRSAVAILLLFSNPALFRWTVSLYEAKPVQLAAGHRFHTGIVLGGMVAYSPRANEGFFNSAADRFIQTALLYKKGHIENIVVAAGNGYATQNGFTEAGFLKARLVELGVPAADIYTDGASRNTLENATNAKAIADTLHTTGPLLLITSALHMPRAERVFRKAGLNVVGYPCDFIGTDANGNFLEDYVVPSSLTLQRWESLMKEWLGTVAYRVTGKG